MVVGEQIKVIAYLMQLEIDAVCVLLLLLDKQESLRPNTQSSPAANKSVTLSLSLATHN